MLRQLGTIRQCQNPTQLGGQIRERQKQKDARLRLFGREPEMKTGAAVLPFSFSDLDARQSGVAKADTAFQAHPLVNRLNLA